MAFEGQFTIPIDLSSAEVVATKIFLVENTIGHFLIDSDYNGDRNLSMESSSLQRNLRPQRTESARSAPKQLGFRPQFEKKFSDRFGGGKRTTRSSRGQRPLSTK
ncbi:MAG: hypothetical protein LW875_11660, partial [Proteobacteria bacterium]|nr:hypothetical protein [Pseudomonadota bacterium]